MVRRAALVLVAVAGCGRPTPDLSLAIRLPADRHLLAAVASLNLSATRNGQVLAQASYSAGASYVSVSGVTPGPGTVVTLEGVAASGDVLARGNTCPLTFQKGGPAAPLYFAPTNFFAPTVGAPLATRADPIAVPLSDGTVLLAGGNDGNGTRRDAELFSPGTAAFTAAAPLLETARSDAEVALVPGIGAVITGGLDDAGMPLAQHEIYDEAGQQFVPFESPLIDARVGHRAVVLADGRVLVTGGQSAPGVALATTAFVRTQTGGTAQVTAGPSL
ncbi:MAG TPA: kelch repeat-containing protein [Polyangia bacterium]